MIQGGIGGANTKTGLHFERKSDFLGLLKKQKRKSYLTMLFL